MIIRDGSEIVLSTVTAIYALLYFRSISTARLTIALLCDESLYRCTDYQSKGNGVQTRKKMEHARQKAVALKIQKKQLKHGN